MTKWELARYLLDAKKSVDSIMYIADVLPELEHIPVRAYVNSNRQTFYICCCVLLDNVYLSKKEKQAIAFGIASCSSYFQMSNWKVNEIIVSL